MGPINEILYHINPLFIVFVIILLFIALGIYYAVWQIGVSNDTTKDLNETLGEIKDEIKKINEDKKETSQPKDFRSRDIDLDKESIEKFCNYIDTISSKMREASQEERDGVDQYIKSISEDVDKESFYKYLLSTNSQFPILTQVEKDLIEQRLKTLAENGILGGK